MAILCAVVARARCVHFTLVAHKWGPIKFKHLPAAARVFARTRSVQTHTEQRFDYVNQTTAGHCGFVVVITTSLGLAGHTMVRLLRLLGPQFTSIKSHHL